MTYPDTNPYTPGQHPPEHKKKHTGRKVVIVVAAITVMIVALIGACTAAVDGVLDVSSIPSTAPATNKAAPVPTTKGVPVEAKIDKVITRDLKLTSCKIGDFDTLAVTVTITNGGNDTATYMVTGDVQNAAGERIGEWNATTSALPAGKVSKSKGFGILDETVKPSTKVRCNITEVTRF